MIRQLLEIAEKKYKNKTVISFQGHKIKVTGEITYNAKNKTINSPTVCLFNGEKWVKTIE